MMKSIYRKWRKYGVFLCIAMLIVGFFLPLKPAGILGGSAMLIMLSIPCGIKEINTNKWLWYCRQAYFIIMAWFILSSVI